MQPLTPDAIRASFINTSQRERKGVPIPDLTAISWDTLDYLGWRDPKQPLLGYVVADIDGEPVGFLVRQAERLPAGKVQCSWCDDVQLPHPVVFFAAKRTGDARWLRTGSTSQYFPCSLSSRDE